MAVHAHPDDESSKGAATTAMYVAAGASVMVVSCTGGERGDILNEKLKDDPHILRDIAQVRRDEMKAAQEVLGCEHTWLGFVDSGLPEGDPLPPLPDGCFAPRGHRRDDRGPRPRHPRVAPARHDDLRREGWLPPPRPHHVPHRVDGGLRGRRRPDALPARGRAVAAAQDLLQRRLVARTASRRSTTPCSSRASRARMPSGWPTGSRAVPDGPRRRSRAASYFETRDRALMAHATQVDPDGFWFQVPLEIQRRVWGVEEFEAALSYVPVAEGEDDLFAGLGSPGRGRRARDPGATSSSSTTAASPRSPSRRRPSSRLGARHGDSSDTHADDDTRRRTSDGWRRQPPDRPRHLGLHRVLRARDRAVAARAQHEQPAAADGLPRPRPRRPRAPTPTARRAPPRTPRQTSRRPTATGTRPRRTTRRATAGRAPRAD